MFRINTEKAFFTYIQKILYITPDADRLGDKTIDLII